MPVRDRRQESLAQNWAAKGALGLGAVGAVAGFVYAWIVNASTAWFGTIEGGVPAFVLGAVAGAACGAIAGTRHRRE